MQTSYSKEEIENKLWEFANEVIDTPFVNMGRSKSGWDCWGLIMEAFKRCFDVILDGPVILCNKCFTVKKAFVREFNKSKIWLIIDGKEKPGDILFLRPCQTALVISNGKVLQSTPETGRVSIIEYEKIKNKVIGIYRHAKLASD